MGYLILLNPVSNKLEVNWRVSGESKLTRTFLLKGQKELDFSDAVHVGLDERLDLLAVRPI